MHALMKTGDYEIKVYAEDVEGFFFSPFASQDFDWIGGEYRYDCYYGFRRCYRYCSSRFCCFDTS